MYQPARGRRPHYRLYSFCRDRLRCGVGLFRNWFAWRKKLARSAPHQGGSGRKNRQRRKSSAVRQPAFFSGRFDRSTRSPSIWVPYLRTHQNAFLTPKPLQNGRVEGPMTTTAIVSRKWTPFLTPRPPPWAENGHLSGPKNPFKMPI